MAQPSTSRGSGSLAPAVDRAFQILEYLAAVSPEAGVTEIANALTMNKSTCYNILQTMTTAGIVTRDSRFPVYRLGPKLVELGTASRRNVNHRDDIKAAIHPIVEKYGITCLIAQPLPNHRGVVVTDRYMPRGEDILSAPIGHVYPITAPAMGRALLAYEDLHESVLQPADFGLKTEAELESFLKDAEDARERGYGESREERNEGVNAVAAVVRGSDGRANLVLCLFGYSHHLPDKLVDQAGRELRALADQVSAELQGAARFA